MIARWLKRNWRLLPALALVALLHACAGQQTLTKSTTPAGKTPPPIAIVELKGMPADKTQMLTDFLAEAAGQRDMAIVQGSFGDGYRLNGSFSAKKGGDGTVITYSWTLSDAEGQELHTISGTEAAGPASGDSWSAAVPDVLRRIATGTADNLAAHLSQLGYAVRTGRLERPAAVTGTAMASAPGAVPPIINQFA